MKRKVAVTQTAVCTLAVGALSAGTSTFVVAAHGGGLSWAGGLAGLASLAVGTWLVYLGHCRNLMADR